MIDYRAFYLSKTFHVSICSEMGPYYEEASKELGWMVDSTISDALNAQNALKLQTLTSAIQGYPKYKYPLGSLSLWSYVATIINNIE